MNRIPALRLYEFGRLIEGYKILPTKIKNYLLYKETVNIKDIFSEFNLFETEEDQEKLISFNLLLKELDKESKVNPRILADKLIVLGLKREVKTLEGIIRKQLNRKIIAYPSARRIDENHLVFEPQKLFGDEHILLNVPTTVLNDFTNFTQCYLYGLYTSAIIHILIATENYNIHFYEKISQTKVERSMKWGVLINNTQAKLEETDKSNSGFGKLVNSLSKLKKDQRIEIIHNNKIVYDEQEAFAVFEDCRIVISKMFYILKDRFPDE